MKNVLVIFSEVPEETHIFTMQVDDNELKQLKSFNGVYVNSSEDTDITDQIMSVFYDNDGYFKFKNQVRPESGTFDYILETGFVL